MTNSGLPSALQDALDNGDPLFTVEICPPMKVTLRVAGSMEIDCTTSSIGYGGQAGVVRLSLSREAVQGLRKALIALETTLDEQSSEIERQPTH